MTREDLFQRLIRNNSELYVTIKRLKQTREALKSMLSTVEGDIAAIGAIVDENESIFHSERLKQELVAHDA